MSESKYLIIWMPFCAGGLGDRLLGIASTYCIARMLKRKFLIKWDNTDLSPAFTINPEFNYYTLSPRFRYIDLNNHQLQAYFRGQDVESDWKDDNIVIWSNQNLYQYMQTNPYIKELPENYTQQLSDAVNEIFNHMFELNPIISTKVSEFSDCDIGVHIRTHDNQIYNEDNQKGQISYITNILTKIKSHLENDQAIFIASDCPLTFKLASELGINFVSMSGPVVHSGTSDPSKLNEEGIRKVLIDMIALSKCKKRLYFGWNTNFPRISAMCNLDREFYCFEHPEAPEQLKLLDNRELCDYFSIGGRS